MPGPTKFQDLVADAVTNHGKATADIFDRLGKGEKVDLVAETMQCFGRLTKTGAQFLIFWDNIATLMAASGGAPLNFPPPKPCGPGVTVSSTLSVSDVASAAVLSGLRRRGEDQETILAKAITVTQNQDTLTLVVDCSGAPRGLYEGNLELVDSVGTKQARPYNIYINPT
jgi:hypothetical protein